MLYEDLTESKWDIQHQCYKYDLREENGYIYTVLQIWSMGI